MTSALLLAEPEPDTRGVLERHLRSDGFDVLQAGEAAADAFELAERHDLALALLGNVELLRRLRAGEPGRSWNRELPAIVLGRPESDARELVSAFAGGADDFISPPFDCEELVARIRAVLRRAAPRARDVFEVGGISIDRRTRVVTVGGRRVVLAQKEYELLLKLASEPARVFSKTELLRDVWGYRSPGSTYRTYPKPGTLRV
jgi:DNA-binding response OmpR family regulator